MKNPTRLVIVQALYQREITESSIARLLEDFFKLMELSQKEASFDYYSKVLQKIEKEEAALDKEIAQVLPQDWQLERLDKVLLVLLRAALSERQEEHWLPDYVEIAHVLLDKKVAAMANAILDKLAA